VYDTVVKNGLLISGHGTVKADIGITGERIAAVGLELEGERTVDASGCLVIPGGVDPHVHLQMPLAGRTSADSFETGTRAAICGGTTTIIDFVTPEPGQSMLAALCQRRREADQNVATDYGLHMTVPDWHASDDCRLAEVAEVAAQGCATFKMYQAYEGLALDDVALLRAMRAVAAASGGVVLHSEVGPVLEVLRREARERGNTKPIWHARTRPASLEASAVQRAVLLAALADVRLYVFHVGAGEVVEAIRHARVSGLKIHAETCPQYLLLTADEHLCAEEGALYICAPPLRSAADQEILWRALEDGTLDVVSTDHCPWLRAEKMQPDFTAAPGGVPSIEARLSLVYHFGVASGRLPLERWVDVCCSAPARLMGLRTKGLVAPGYDADLVVFDPSQGKRISVDTLHEAADWTPYDGLEVTGWPRTVLLRGRVAVEDGDICSPGLGRFMERKLI
jgi:dihydropyrimidinase